MTLSPSLLLVAALVALIPMAIGRFRAPASVRDLERMVVSGTATLLAGAVAARLLHGLDLFGVMHLFYLVGVVTVPLLFGIWFVAALARGRLRRIDTIVGVLAVGAGLLGLYGTHIEPNWLRTDHAVVSAGIDGVVRIGVLADLQTPNVGSFEEKVVDELLDQRPDLVVMPGDVFQGDAEEITAERAEFVALLNRLVEGSSLVAVTSGDSDHSIPLGPMVEEAGALFIDDTIRSVQVAGVPIRLAGIRVLANGPARGETLEALREPTDELSLLVAHRPDAVYDLAPDVDVDLVISGHTHGGQVAIPFFGPPVTFSSVPRSLAAGGLGVVDNVPLYVSAGAGMERHQAPQVRIGVRPEIGIIDVIPAG